MPFDTQLFRQRAAAAGFTEKEIDKALVIIREEISARATEPSRRFDDHASEPIRARALWAIERHKTEFWPIGIACLAGGAVLGGLVVHLFHG
jgi:hypothetical protein